MSLSTWINPIQNYCEWDLQLKDNKAVIAPIPLFIILKFAFDSLHVNNSYSASWRKDINITRHNSWNEILWYKNIKMAKVQMTLSLLYNVDVTLFLLIIIWIMRIIYSFTIFLIIIITLKRKNKMTPKKRPWFNSIFMDTEIYWVHDILLKLQILYVLDSWLVVVYVRFIVNDIHITFKTRHI